MAFPLNSETITAIISALGGGVIVKWIDKRYQWRSKTFDAATAFRAELQKDITDLKDELKTLESDLDVWKLKYYTLLERHSLLMSKYDILRNRISYLTGFIEPSVLSPIDEDLHPPALLPPTVKPPDVKPEVKPDETSDDQS